MNINTNLSINSLYTALYQNQMSIHFNRLNKNYYPPNRAQQGSPQLSSDALEYMGDIRSASSALTSSIKELSGPAFSARTATSSNTDVMTVKYSGNRPNSITSMKVKVDQTAAGQQNEGSRLTANAAYEGTQGTNTIAIETGGKTTQISVNASEGDTNRTVQQRMVDAINNAGINVKATLVNDTEANTSTIRLESTVTGSDEKNSFTVRDVTGDMASQTGVNEVTREGRDAIYSINGGETRTSQSNTVNLGNDITATFKQASSEAVVVAPGQDTSASRNAIEDMVKSYNNLFSAAAQNTDDPKAQSLASRLLSTVSLYSGALSDIGIGFDSSGRMRIDSERMNKAQESGRLERFFTENSGRNFGFTNQLSRLADNVSRNPGNYVSSSMFGSNLSQNFAYSSFGDLIQYNYLSAGSILDYMF